MLGKIEGRRREQQRMRLLDGITISRAMSLSKLWEILKESKAWHAVVHGVTKSQTQLSIWATTSVKWKWRVFIGTEIFLIKYNLQFVVSPIKIGRTVVRTSRAMLLLFKKKKTLYFNWRIIALQGFVGFCRISTWINHGDTYVFPSSTSLPPPTPSHPSRLS